VTKTGIAGSFVVTHFTVWSVLTQTMHTVKDKKQWWG